MADDRTLTLGTIFTARAEGFLSATSRMRRAILSINNAMAGTASETNKANKQLDRAKTKTKQTGDSFQTMGKQIAKAGNGIERLKAAFKVTAAYGIAARAIFGVVEAAQAGTREIIEFDQAMQNIAAITGATTEQLDLMKDVMLDIAERTKFSTTEIAEGMVLLGQAGFSAGEATNAIGAAADLAAGTLTDLTTTTDLLTTTIRAFSLNAIEAGRVADVMANAINKSKLTVDKIRTSFNFVGAAAAQVGLSLEETAASMALLANSGLRASTIGTGFRQVLSRMIAPNKKLRDAFKEFRIEVDTINPKVQGYEAAMKNLTSVLLKADGVTVDMTKAFELFGLRGAQAVAVLTKGFVGPDFQEMLDKMFEVGAAEAMAGIQAEGLAFKLKNLLDRAKNLAIALGDAGVAGALELVTDAMRFIVSTITDFVNTTVGSLFLKLGLVTTAVVGFALAIKFATSVVVGFGTAILAFGGPISIAVAALAGLVVVVNHFTSATERATKEAEKNAEELLRQKGSLESYKGALQSVISSVDETNKVSKEHIALLDRMKKAHPELATVINDSSTSYKNFGDILKATNAEIARVATGRIAELVESGAPLARSIEKQKERLEEAKKTTAEIVENMSDLKLANTQFPAAIFNAQEKLAALLEQQREKTLLLKGAVFSWALALDKTKGQTDALVKSMVGANGITEEQRDIIIKELIPAFEKLNEARGDDKDKAVQDRIDEDRKALLRFETFLLTLQSDREKRIEQEHTKTLAKINKFREDELVRLVKAGFDEKVAKAKVIERVEKLTDAADNRRSLKLEQLALDREQLERKITRTEEEINLLSDEKMAVQEGKSLKNIENLKREHRIKIAQDDVEFAEEVHRTLLNSTVASHEDILKAEADFVAKRKALRVAETADAIGDEKDRQRLLKPKEGLKDISEELKKVLDGTQDLSEAWKNMNQSVAVATSEGFGNAILSIIDGSKSAKDAFADMARSMLKWMAELIIKQQILNSLRSFFPGFFGGGGGGGLPGPVSASPPPMDFTTPNFHAGGVAGGGRISRTGLRSNEIPAILRKDETVFTPDQMRVLGEVISSKRSEALTVINDFNGATFLDRKQLMDTIAAVSEKVAELQVSKGASNAVLRDYGNDHPIRNIFRSRA